MAEQAYRDAAELPDLLKQSQTLAHLLHLERRGAVERAKDEPDVWSLT